MSRGQLAGAWLASERRGFPHHVCTMVPCLNRSVALMHPKIVRRQPRWDRRWDRSCPPHWQWAELSEISKCAAPQASMLRKLLVARLCCGVPRLSSLSRPPAGRLCAGAAHRTALGRLSSTRSVARPLQRALSPHPPPGDLRLLASRARCPVHLCARAHCKAPSWRQAPGAPLPAAH